MTNVFFFSLTELRCSVWSCKGFWQRAGEEFPLSTILLHCRSRWIDLVHFIFSNDLINGSVSPSQGILGPRGPPGPPGAAGPAVSSYTHTHTSINVSSQVTWSHQLLHPAPWTCSFCHSTGTSGTHRTPWWARRAWTDCKTILLKIHNRLFVPCQTSELFVIFEILNFLVLSPKGPAGARGPPGPAGKSGDDVRMHWSFVGALFRGYFMPAKRSNVNVFCCWLSG